MSVYTLLSWASSMTTTLYLSSRKSWWGRSGGEASQPGLSTPGSLCTPRCLLKEPLW